MASKIGDALDALAHGKKTTLGSEEIVAVRGVVGLIACLIIFAGVALAYFGVLLVSKGSVTGETSIDILGIMIKTSSVGIAAIAMGAAVIVLTLKRLIDVLVEAAKK